MKITVKQMVLVALFAALIAIGAFIQIPIPFMDYFTLQFLFVVLAGMILGAKLGMISVALYVAIGLIGIPIFAAGGGIQYIFRPSFGYLLGFIVSAFVVGALTERLISIAKKQDLVKYIIIALIGMIITYIIGFGYKYVIMNFYIKEPTALWAIITASLTIDIPGDIFLCVGASLIAGRVRKALKLSAA